MPVSRGVIESKGWLDGPLSGGLDGLCEADVVGFLVGDDPTIEVELDLATHTRTIARPLPSWHPEAMPVHRDWFRLGIAASMCIALGLCGAVTVVALFGSLDPIVDSELSSAGPAAAPAAIRSYPRPVVPDRVDNSPVPPRPALSRSEVRSAGSKAQATAASPRVDFTKAHDLSPPVSHTLIAARGGSRSEVAPSAMVLDDPIGGGQSSLTAAPVVARVPVALAGQRRERRRLRREARRTRRLEKRL